MRLPRLALVASLVASGLLVAAPAAAFASWQQLTTANLGSDVWELAAVSCTSPRICMAVGDISSPASQLLSETRSPSGWTVRPVPQPAAGSDLFAVSCVKASDCIAVGRKPSGGSGSLPLAEHWNGSSWTIQSTLVPPGTSSSQLFAVSCVAASRCVAVGEEVKGGHDAPFSEVLGAAGWKVHLTPKPAVPPDSDLNGVSCPAKTRCFAVGESFKNGVDKPLAEAWNGTKWAISKTPSPASGGGLGAVSCVSVTKCMAVGGNLAERWNGKTWSALKIGKPSGTAASLSGVSCAKAGPCYAVGDNFTEGVQGSVAESWNGSRWSVQPVPITTSFDSSLLEGVSCTTATNCTAVGSYHDPVDGDRALAEDFTIRWQDVSPQPFNGVVATGLNAVSCASASDCLAVGTFETTKAFESFSQRWDGSGWTTEVMPKPKVTNIDAISCPAANSCEAVGNLSTGVNEVPQAEHWNGGAWALQKTPAPALVSSGSGNGFLIGASCGSSTSCAAVGFTTKKGKEHSLAEVWNGKTWKVTPTPNPAGQQFVELNSVSCSSAKFCLAVGTFAGGTFAATWNGKHWGVTGPVPNAKGTIHSALLSVACPTARDCLAVGDSSTPKSVPLAERWDGKKWSPLKITAPHGASASGLDSISCSSGTACGAVGSVTRKSGDSSIAYAWTGKHWVSNPIAIPSGALSVLLEGVACNSATACLAVGDFNDASNTEQMLAEQYS